MPDPIAKPAEEQFGALIYKTRNMGDEIQTLAALRFLRRVDYLVDRDNLATFSETDHLSMILNGWFAERPSSWPPSAAIRPLLVSFHLSPMRGAFDLARVSAADFFLREPAVEYLRHYGPVGARDLDTLHLLEQHRVPSYFSGCLTLTTQRFPDVAPGEDIVLNDVPDEVLSFVTRQTRRRVVANTHEDALTPAGDARLAKARSLLRLYQAAHLVITTRLHCALPCLALGTNVVLLKVGQEPSRFGGLEDLLRTGSVPDFLAGRVVDLERPEPNPSAHEGLRATLEKTVSAFVASAATEARRDPKIVPAELRAETLLALHAEGLAAQDALRLDVERSRVDLERSRADLEKIRQELARTQAELATSVTQRDGDRRSLLQLDEEVKRMRASRSWRLAETMQVVAARFPRAAAPLRRLLKHLPDLKA